jgi:hypothetical protein
MKNITITQWAFNLATLTLKLSDSAKPYQAAYKAATPEQAHQLRVEWRVGYLMGKCGVDAIKAAQIAGQTRVERSAKHEAAVNLASKQFATYVSCTSTRATKAAKPLQQVAIPRALKSELAALIEAYGADVVRAALKAAK